MFHCPVGVWVIEQHAIILSATVRSPAVYMGLWTTEYREMFAYFGTFLKVAQRRFRSTRCLFIYQTEIGQVGLETV